MKISVLMITYGHENYIRQAIESVLAQQTAFAFELVVANDASSDNTHGIITDIIENHPDGNKIKYIQQPENIGMQANFASGYKQCQGQYIALCEGDDYWTDPSKLQKQVTFLENNPGYVMCFHKVDIRTSDGNFTNDFITNVPENHETLHDMARLGNYIHTPTVCFRNVITAFPKEFIKTPIGDYFLYLMLMQHGKVKFLDQTMAVYRHNVGVFSGTVATKKVKKNILMYACILSFFEDEVLREIILNRLDDALNWYEAAISNPPRSKSKFLRAMRFLKANYKNPGAIFKKIYRPRID